MTGTGKHSLIVDDEAVVRDFLVSALEMAGFQVESVADGQEALKHVRKHPVDLMVVDFFMPGMDGRQLHEELCRWEHPLARRMIFISGNTLDNRVTDFLQTSGSLSLQKPFHVAEIHAVVSRLLEAEDNGQRPSL